MFKKLAAIRIPEIPNVKDLWCESVTSQGRAASVEATVAPNPTRTSTDGSAQQSSVPTEPNREK